MQNLVEGNDCGGDNPMMGFVKHFTQDKGRAQTNGYGRPASHQGTMRPQDPTQLLPMGQQHGGAQFVDGGGLAQDLARLRMGGEPPQSVAQHWANDFQVNGPPQMAQPLAQNPRQIAEFERVFAAGHAASAAGWADDYQRQLSGPLGPNQGLATMSPQEAPQLEASWVEARAQTHDWAAEFLEADHEQVLHPSRLTDEQLELKETAESLIRESDDPKFKNSKFMNFIKQLGSGEVTLDGNKVVKSAGTAAQWASEFQETKRQAGGPSTAVSWENEFSEAARIGPEHQADSWAKMFDGGEVAGWANEFESTIRESEAMGGIHNLQSAWDSAAAEEKWSADFEEQQNGGAAAVSRPAHGYVFEVENPFMSDRKSYDDMIAMGMESLQSGALSTAILWYEAAVQHEPEREEGWEYLGLCQAENEQEVQSIKALSECTRLVPSRSSAHLALAVSFTNELRYNEAYDALEAAIRSNPKYRNLPPPIESTGETRRFLPLSKRHESVRDLYIAAAQRSPDQLDADVQTGLGVIFNISNDYGKAVDCFESALQIRPNDFGLWNKLGATLANGDRSAEAVEAYGRALELRPGYIRARYNLGISCINLKAYRDASEHFLAALKLQQLATRDSSRRNMSETIWHSLRTSLLMGNRQDLADLTRERNLELFRTHFEF